LKIEVENERKLRHQLEQEASKSLELALSEQQQELDDSIAAEKQEIKAQFEQKTKEELDELAKKNISDKKQLMA